MVSIEEQVKIIMKGAEEIIDREELKEKLIKAEREGKQLIVKLGLDPSAPDIHLGHAVVLRKIKQMQDLGHKAVIIIGDFTGRIGDPTGKSKTRKQLSKEEVLTNARTYKEQIFKILHKEKTEVRFNSEWLEKLNFKEVIELAAKTTVARMLEREDFKNRFRNQISIGIHEFFYPLMQAYDSIAINADVELGGTDQRFNLLMGRTLQGEYNKEKQITIFMPLLEGTDGKEKMSKSLGNYIGIEEGANEMYIKVMEIPDALIVKYFELCTDLHPDIIDSIKLELAEDKVNPRDIKMRLAREIVALYHDEIEANKAEEYFKNLFKEKKNLEKLKTIKIKMGMNVIDAILELCPNISKSEARRLIKQGGVKLNEEKISKFEENAFKENDILQVGKKKLAKIAIEE